MRYESFVGTGPLSLKCINPLPELNLTEFCLNRHKYYVPVNNSDIPVMHFLKI